MKHAETPGPGQVTDLLRRWRAGDSDALGQLIPLVYGELRRVALWRCRGATGDLSPTELVHEAFLRLVEAPPDAASRGHFYSIAARAMRQVLVDASRERQAAKRGAGLTKVPFDEAEQAHAAATGDVLALNDALNELAGFDARKAAVLEMRYFAGMSAEEIGGALAVSAPTVNRELRAAHAWLRQHLSGEA